jgi:hypothetical protein
MLGEPKHEDDEEDNDDYFRLFVNVTTGRILRRRLRCLRHNLLVGASDGLLVLADSTRTPSVY